jgi:hypothetical protein
MTISPSVTTSPNLPAVRQVLNLTPHPVTIIHDDGQQTTFMPSGVVARMDVSYRAAGQFGSVPLVTLSQGRLEGLPPERSGVYFIVSSIVFREYPERMDLLYPTDMVRDSRGKITGCKALMRRVPA